MKRILFCAPQVPAPDRDSGSKRIDDGMLLLQEAGWDVGLLAERSIAERYQDRLRQRGVQVWIDPKPSASHPALDWQPQAAVFCFWKTAERWMPLLRQRRPRARLIVDSIDLHFVRQCRQAFSGAPTGLLDPEQGFDFIGELNVYAAADAVWAVSEQERRLVDGLLGHPQRAFCIPDGEESIPPGPGFAERRGILFVGNFGHPPNSDAARFLCQEIVPRLDSRLLQQHPVTIAGDAPSQEIREMAHRCGVKVTGWLPSLQDYYRRALMTVAPLRFGAGTKRKVVQSLMAGTPCVSTPVGVEGLGLEHGRHVLVADDPAGLAGSMERLQADPALWQDLSRRGRERILIDHDRQAVASKLLSAMDAVLARPPRPSGLALAVRQQRRHWMKRHYEQLIERIRFVASRRLPCGARVLVASKGDEELLQLEGCAARHFPSASDGVYLGHHPTDGKWAVRQLEEGKGRGFRYFLLPSTALWWLDHYTDLAAHLQRRCRLIEDRPDSCLIWDLNPEAPIQGRDTQGN